MGVLSRLLERRREKKAVGEQLHSGISRLKSEDEFDKHAKQLATHWGTWKKVPKPTQQQFYYSRGLFYERQAEDTKRTLNSTRDHQIISNLLRAADSHRRVSIFRNSLHEQLRTIFATLDYVSNENLADLIHPYSGPSLESVVTALPARVRRKYGYDRNLRVIRERIQEAAAQKRAFERRRTDNSF